MDVQHVSDDSHVSQPEIEEIETVKGRRWRVSYAGMVKEHEEKWRAERHYEEACEVYGRHLGLRRWLT